MKQAHFYSVVASYDDDKSLLDFSHEVNFFEKPTTPTPVFNNETTLFKFLREHCLGKSVTRLLVKRTPSKFVYGDEHKYLRLARHGLGHGARWGGVPGVEDTPDFEVWMLESENGSPAALCSVSLRD